MSTTITRPVEVDTELARIYNAENRIAATIANLEGRIRQAAGDTNHRRNSYSYNRMETLVTVSITDALALGPVDGTPAYEVSNFERATAELYTAYGEREALAAEAAPFHAEFRAAPWSRFFIVPDGHIHSSMGCYSCNNGQSPTQFGWLPQLSGLTEADAVEAHGATLCTLCFPEAPVEWTGGEAKAKIEAREIREAAKAERAAKKLAKALLPDGSEVRVGTYERFSTLTAAKSWLTDAAMWNADGRVHPSFQPFDVDRVAGLVAAKLGTTVEVELAAAAKRAAKRR